MNLHNFSVYVILKKNIRSEKCIKGVNRATFVLIFSRLWAVSVSCLFMDTAGSVVLGTFNLVNLNGGNVKTFWMNGDRLFRERPLGLLLNNLNWQKEDWTLPKIQDLQPFVWNCGCRFILETKWWIKDKWTKVRSIFWMQFCDFFVTWLY